MHYGSNGPQLDFDGARHTSTSSNGFRMPSAHSFPLLGRKYTACHSVKLYAGHRPAHTHCCATDWVSSAALQAKAACGIGWVCCVRVASHTSVCSCPVICCESAMLQPGTKAAIVQSHQDAHLESAAHRHWPLQLAHACGSTPQQLLVRTGLCIHSSVHEALNAGVCATAHQAGSNARQKLILGCGAWSRHHMISRFFSMSRRVSSTLLCVVSMSTGHDT